MISRKNSKVIEAMKETLTRAGYEEDSYGNYITTDKTLRFKFNETDKVIR